MPVLQTTTVSAAPSCSTDRTRTARESKPWCDSESPSLGTQRCVFVVCVCIFRVGRSNRRTNENVQPRSCGRVASYELLWCQRFLFFLCCFPIILTGGEEKCPQFSDLPFFLKERSREWPKTIARARRSTTNPSGTNLLFSVSRSFTVE